MGRARVFLVLALLALALLLALRDRGDDASGGGASPQAAPPAPRAADDDNATGTREDAIARAEQIDLYARAMRAAVSTLHRYLAALPGPDRAAADAFWAGGTPPRDADEADLRTLPAAPTHFRTRNRTPEALDRSPVPGAVRIPVELRLGLEGQPTRRYAGWYELRRTADSDGWQLVNASIDAVAPPQ